MQVADQAELFPAKPSLFRTRLFLVGVEQTAPAIVPVLRPARSTGDLRPIADLRVFPSSPALGPTTLGLDISEAAVLGHRLPATTCLP